MAKKSRPLQRSYAGVARSVSGRGTQKKTGMRFINVIRAPLLEEIAALTSSLAEAAKLLKSGEEAMYQNTKVVVELNQKLADLQRQLAAKDKELEADERRFAANGAGVDFLWEEIDRYRNRLIQHLEWDAMLPEDLREAVRKVRVQAYADEHDDDEADDRS